MAALPIARLRPNALQANLYWQHAYVELRGSGLLFAQMKAASVPDVVPLYPA